MDGVTAAACCTLRAAADSCSCSTMRRSAAIELCSQLQTTWRRVPAFRCRCTVVLQCLSPRFSLRTWQAVLVSAAAGHTESQTVTHAVSCGKLRLTCRCPRVQSWPRSSSRISWSRCATKEMRQPLSSLPSCHLFSCALIAFVAGTAAQPKALL